MSPDDKPGPTFVTVEAAPEPVRTLFRDLLRESSASSGSMNIRVRVITCRRGQSDPGWDTEPDWHDARRQARGTTR